MKILTRWYVVGILIAVFAMVEQVSASDNYTEWASGQGVSSPNGDPEGDGVPNLLEYVFNTNPNLSEELLPTYTRQSNSFSISLRLRNNMDSEVSVRLQESNDLRGGWSNVMVEAGDLSETPLDADTDNVRAILRDKSFPYFLRLYATYKGISVTAPVAPQQLSADGGQGQAVVSWDPVEGASSYTLFFGTNSGVNAQSSSIPSVSSPFIHSGLENNQDYYYVLQAQDASGGGFLSAEAHARTADGATPAPQNLVSVASSNSVALSWNAVPGATSYNIRVLYYTSGTVTMSDTLLTSTSGTNHTHVIPYVGYWYSYAVTAIGPHGESAISGSTQAMPEVLQPQPPGRTSPYLSPLDQAMHISWTFIEDADSYNLYWTTNGEASVSSTFLGSFTDTSAVHTGLVNGVTYSYMLETVNAHGTTPWYYGTEAVPGGVPRFPINWAAEAVAGDGQAAVSWEAVPGATGYDIYWAPFDKCYKSEDYTLTANVTSPVVFNGLSNGTEYYYYVWPHNGAGPANIYSVRSRAVKATPRAVQSPPALAPTGLTVNGAERQNVVEWNESSDAGSYTVYWSTHPSVNTNSNKETVLHSPWVHAGLENWKPVYYKVASVNQIGEGPTSAEVSAFPSPAAAAPGTPQNLSVTEYGYRRAKLEWDPVPGATSYRLYWTLGAGMTGDIAYVDGIVTPTFLHRGLSAAHTYRYAVVAMNARGDSPISAERTYSPSSVDPQGKEKSHYHGASERTERNRMWIPQHLLASGEFKGVFLCDEHGALKGVDRTTTYRRFAERNDFLILRIGKDDYNTDPFLESEAATYTWMNETLGYKRDLGKLPRIVAGLSSAGRSCVNVARAHKEYTLANIIYAQPIYGVADPSIPVLCSVGSLDHLSYAHTVGVSNLPDYRENYGVMASVIFGKGYPHNSLHNEYLVPEWMSAVIDLRLRPDGSIAPVNTDESVMVDYDATYSGSTLTSIANVTVSNTFDQFSRSVWLPNAKIGEDWTVHLEHPFAYWLETAAADYLPLNKDTTLSTQTGDSNSGGTVSSMGWSQFSGPGTATFGSTTATETTVRFDTAGTYVLRLTIQDNDSNIRTEDLTITAGP